IFLSALVCAGGMGAALASYRPAMIAKERPGERLGAGALAGASITSGLWLCVAGFGAPPMLDLASASVLLAALLFSSALAIASFEMFASPSRHRVAASGALLAAGCALVDVFYAVSPGLTHVTPAIDGGEGGV